MSEEPREDAPVDEFAAKQAAGDPVPVETQQGVGNNPLPHQGGTGPVDDVRDPEGDSGQPQTSAELAEQVADEEARLDEEDDAFYPRAEAPDTQNNPRRVTGTSETTTTTTTASDEDEE